jgi:hypothetical protein
MNSRLYKIKKFVIMKTYISIFSMMLLLLISCNKDDDLLIEGKWSMINATGGIAGVNQNFPEGQINWTFDNGTLKIENKYTGQFNVSFPTGTYTYQEINLSNISTLYINDQQFGDFIISKESLVIDQSSFMADGFRYTFIRQ